MSHNKLSIKQLFSFFKTAISSNIQEFTSGSIRKAIFMLSVPMVLEMMMESVFFLVDAYYVSSLGAGAIATVGLTESVLTLIYAVAIGLSMSVTAIIARRVGEKNINKASQTAVQSIILGIVISILISIIGVIYPKEILTFMGADSDVVANGYTYTQILLGGNVTILLLFLINAIFRGAGDASVAMKVLIFSNLLNIILDPIFIFGFGPIKAFGLQGAAIATTIGRGSAVVLQLFILLYGWSKIKIAFKDIIFNTGIMINLIRVSLGGIGQFIIGTSSWVFLMRIMAEFGSEVLAGYTIAIRVLMFTLMPSWGMSNAAATLVGQNLGANRPKRAEQSVWLTGKYNAYFMLVVSVFYLVFAETIIRIFSTEPLIIEYGSMCLRFLASSYVFYAYGMVIIQAFNGAGDTRTPTLINFFCFWVIQIPFAYVTALTLNWGVKGVFSAIILAEILIATIGIVLFRKGKWKVVKV